MSLPPLNIPPPSGLAELGRDELLHVIHDKDQEISELQELVAFREAQLQIVREDGYYEGFLVGQAAKVRYTDWGGEDG
jgi:hypothetical protein